MLDVFTYLFVKFQEFDSLPSRQTINDILIEAGFEHEQIIRTLLCFDELLDNDHTQMLGEFSANSFRVYSYFEQKILSTEIIGFLQFLTDQGGISFAEREYIIQALTKLPINDINLETTKIIVLVLLWANQSELPILIGDELLSVLKHDALIN